MSSPYLGFKIRPLRVLFSCPPKGQNLGRPLQADEPQGHGGHPRRSRRRPHHPLGALCLRRPRPPQRRPQGHPRRQGPRRWQGPLRQVLLRREPHHRRVHARGQARGQPRHRREHQPEQPPLGQGHPRGGGHGALADRPLGRGGADEQGAHPAACGQGRRLLRPRRRHVLAVDPLRVGRGRVHTQRLAARVEARPGELHPGRDHVAVCLPDGTDGAGHRLSLFIGVGHAHRGDGGDGGGGKERDSDQGRCAAGESPQG